MAVKKKLIEEEEKFNDQPEEVEATEEGETAEEIEENETFEEEMAHEGTDEIFPFGPTYDQVEDWKSRFDNDLYMSDFNNEVFIWRPIRRKEYRDIQRVEGVKDEYYMEEAICRTCVLYPEDYAMHKITFGKAGLPTTLSQLIMERSGFLRPATVKL